MSAVTIDNAKILSQRMSKSRSLTKLSERRLQPVAYAGGASMRAPPSSLLRYMLKACVAQIVLEKSYINVENFLRAIGARKGGGGGTVP